MPSKIQLDENLWFLFICLQKSDYKTIDFNAVGQATNLKSPAARMRYTRLRRQIEGGTLLGAHGTPFSRISERIAPDMKKRKKDSPLEMDKGRHSAVFSKAILPGREIKAEQEEFSKRYETDYTECSDSEDEIPLAKRRLGRINTTDMPFEGFSAATTNPEISSGLLKDQENSLLIKSPPGACHEQDITGEQFEMPGKYSNVFQAKDSTSYSFGSTKRFLHAS